jgi:hypothetical protein
VFDLFHLGDKITVCIQGFRSAPPRQDKFFVPWSRLYEIDDFLAVDKAEREGGDYLVKYDQIEVGIDECAMGTLDRSGCEQPVLLF